MPETFWPQIHTVERAYPRTLAFEMIPWLLCQAGNEDVLYFLPYNNVSSLSSTGFS